MSGRGAGEVERLHLGLAQRVVGWSLAAWAVGTLGAAALGWLATAGFALGAALSLGLFSLHRALVVTCVRPERWRRRRVVFWLVWVVKWPALGTLLYIAVRGGWVAPAWLCAGVALVPAVATALALHAVIADGWRRRCPLGLGR